MDPLQRELEILVRIADLRKEDRLSEAEDLCRRFSSVEYPHPTALLLLAELGASLGHVGLIPQLVSQLSRVALRRSRHFDQFHQFAGRLLPRDALAKAASFLDQNGGLSHSPFHASCLSGRLFELEDDFDSALQAYERAYAMDPGYDFVSSRRATLRLRQAFGEPGAAARHKGQPDSLPRDRPIAMSALGTAGRFGNQLVQYAFLRLYGAAHGVRVEVPRWMGRYLFDLDDPPVANMLPAMDDKDLCMAYALRPRLAAGFDIWGYFQYRTQIYRPQKDMFRTLFRPGEKLEQALEPLQRRLSELGGTLVVLHLRRGDFGSGRFWITPESWYLEWLAAQWPQWDRPVLYIATDAPDVLPAFDAYSPITAADLAEPIAGVEFYTDFHVMRHADILAISNSTFSFVAGLLNDKARAFLRPHPQKERLVPFDPWDAEFTLAK